MKRSNVVLLFLASSLSTMMLPLAKSYVLLDEFTLDFPCYAPAKITFNYAYTHNHSIKDITTVGKSLYKHSGGPTYIEFIAEDVDTYHFTIELFYSKPTNQSILVGLWSGSLSMQGLTLSGQYEKIVIYVKLSVTEEPKYPSDEEVAQAVTSKIAKSLAEQQNQISNLMQKLELATTTNSVLSMITVVAVIVVTVIAFTELRRIRRGQ